MGLFVRTRYFYVLQGSPPIASKYPLGFILTPSLDLTGSSNGEIIHYKVVLLILFPNAMGHLDPIVFTPGPGDHRRQNRSESQAEIL
jgi:hypothetical protein